MTLRKHTNAGSFPEMRFTGGASRVSANIAFEKENCLTEPNVSQGIEHPILSMYRFLERLREVFNVDQEVRLSTYLKDSSKRNFVSSVVSLHHSQVVPQQFFHVNIGRCGVNLKVSPTVAIVRETQKLIIVHATLEDVGTPRSIGANVH